MPARVSTLETEKTMKHLGAAMGFGMAIVGALAQPAAPDSLSRDMAARIEAIPIQTLTISDEPFLKGDAYGRPTTIAGVLRVAQGSGRLPLAAFAEGVRLARQAIELGRDDAVALWSGGNVLVRLARDPEAAVVVIDRACTLNPNSASAWEVSGFARVNLGDLEVAIAHFAQAMRLSPVDPMISIMLTGIAASHFYAGRIEEAASWAERAWRERPNWLPTLRLIAASNALARHSDRAQMAVARLHELDPEFRVSSLKDWEGPLPAAYLARLEEGLRKAGLPE